MRIRVLFFLLVIVVSCKKSETFDYRSTSTDVFESSFIDILDLMKDTIPPLGTIFFLDTLSIESSKTHVRAIKNLTPAVPDYWSKELVDSLMKGFSFYKSSIKPERLDLEYQFIVNPNKINSLSSAEREKDFGTVRLSEFHYNEDKSKVMFFVVFYCGNVCSEGGIVYALKNPNSGNWELDSVLEVWSSGSG